MVTTNQNTFIMNKTYFNFLHLVLIGLCLMVYALEPSPDTWKASNIFLYIVALCIYISITFFPSTDDEYQLPIKLGLPLSAGLAVTCFLQHLTMETIKTPEQMNKSIYTTIMMFVVFGLLSNMYSYKKIYGV